MLEKLNEEQEKQIEIIRNKWIDRALNSNGEYNEKNLKDGIDWLYSLVNLPPPKFKIIVNSPLAAQFAFNFITEIFKILKDKELKVNDQINDQVTSQVRNQIWDQVRNQVGSQYINFLSRGLSWDSGWLAFFDYFGIIGIKLTDNFRKYESYIKQGFWDAILFENVVIIITPPIKVLQQNNRLHSNTEAAVQWLDGTENYFIEGVGFGKDIFEKIRDKKLTSDEAVNLRNVEQRTIAMRKIGYENVIRELGANILHTDGDYQLISVDMKDDDVPAKFVKVKCPSTGKEVLLRVDPKDTNIIDCMSAVSWTFVLNKEEYKPEIET